MNEPELLSPSDENKKTLEESSVQIKEDKRLELAGAWADFPDLDSIRGTRVADVKREVL